MRNFSKSSVFAGIGMAAAVVAVGACLTAAVPAVAAGGNTAGQTLAQATAVSYDAVCPGFVDADGDGLCDNCEARATQGHHGCASYVDENKDGVCDTCTNVGAGRVTCEGYIDADGDSICDNCDGAGNHACGSRANANGGGICTGHGNGHHGSTLGHHGGGWGHGHC